MSLTRFLDQCRMMRDHLGRRQDASGHWARHSTWMLQQVRANTEAPLFSSRLFLMERFGGGFQRPDRLVMRRQIGERLIDRYTTLVRRAFGYGRLSSLVLGPFARQEVIWRAIEGARTNYQNAVEAGALVLRDKVMAFDIRSTSVFGEQAVDVGGRQLSWLTLVSLKRALLVSREAGPVDTMLEIGSGTGEFARLMLLTRGARRCVLVDIPPALAFAQEVLLSQFGADELSMFDPNRTQLPASARCVFLTPDQINLVSDADLGVNVASFGEMPRGQVFEYVNRAKRIGIAQFISINARRPHPVNAAEHIDEGLYREAFAPDYALHGNFAWSKGLDLDMRPIEDTYVGYQWLHFVRARPIEPPPVSARDVI